jgi:hypothetical protein
LSGSSFAENTLGNPPNTVDGLQIVEGAKALLAGADAQNVRATSDGSGVTLAPGALSGSITLGPVQTKFPFNEALPSWNGWAPKDGGFRIWISPVMNGQPAGWFQAGAWGNAPDEKTSGIAQLPYGVYNVDTLQLSQPAQGVLVRIDFARATGKTQSPTLRLFALSYTNSIGDSRLYATYGRRDTGAPLKPVSIDVPYYSQVVPDEKLIGRICSPCSITMALGAYGISAETQSIASELYDRSSDAYGVWHRSVQGAAQHGLRGYVTRFRTWADVQNELNQHHVIVASIRFKPGEVQDPLAPYGKRRKGTQGHLVLIRGISSDGKIIVHDTASRDYGVSELWAPAELGKAWFDKGGVAYVFTGKRTR